MKVIVIGGRVTIGRPVADALSARHEVISVGRSSGEYRADIASRDSIVRLFEAVAPFDAVVSPPWVSETLEEMGQDGSRGMPAAQVAAAYVESVEGRRSGETLDARDFRAS